jgi:hypothetical protein
MTNTPTLTTNFTEKAKTILTALGFEINENTVTPPLWR